MLDGSLGWVHNTNYAGFKRIDTPVGTLNNPKGNRDSKGLVKYDGSILKGFDNFSGADQHEIVEDGRLILTISNSDSGWLESMSPSQSLIKAYFNGWKYTGDGTNHSWVSIVDGTTAPAQQTTAFVANPANKPNGYQNYFLTYQLAKPVIEVEGIDFPYVEGDLAISGNAQIEVTSGFDVTTDPETGKKVYTMWTDRSGTANLTEVKATYKRSMMSSLGGVVTDLAGAKTDIGILFGLTAELLRAFKGLEGA